MQAPNDQQYIVEMGMFFWIVTILKDKLTFYNTIMTQRLCILLQQTHKIPDEEPLEYCTHKMQSTCWMGIMYHASRLYDDRPSQLYTIMHHLTRRHPVGVSPPIDDATTPHIQALRRPSIRYLLLSTPTTTHPGFTTSTHHNNYYLTIIQHGTSSYRQRWRRRWPVLHLKGFL